MAQKEAEILIEGYTKKGCGYGFGPTQKQVDVPGALIGDKILAALKNRGKKGRILSIVEPSKDRTSFRCSHGMICGGCLWQAMDYKAQLQQKEAIIQRAFQEFHTEIYPMIPAKDPWEYRNKMEFSFSENRAGTKYLGLMIQGAASYVFNVDRCHLAKSWFSEVLNRVRKWWEESNLNAYDVRDQSGSLRTLILREGTNTQEKLAMLTLSGSPDEPLAREVIDSFKEAVGPNVEIFLRYQHTQKGTPTRFYLVPLTKRDYILEKLHISNEELTFKVSPTSFFQPNTKQAELLYETALSLFEKEIHLAYDLYSGTGTLGMIMAGRAKEVIGIEINPEAASDARENAKLNGIENFMIYEGDAGKVLTALLSKKDFIPPDSMIVDPPRAGLDPLALNQIKILSPKQLVYISCNPYTQAENIKELISFGYLLKKIVPVDQFPHTYHIENIAYLTKQVC